MSLPNHPLLCVLVYYPPSPTLREILDAYKAKGDGDRDMLLAMLNAKSSEDQVGLLSRLHTATVVLLNDTSLPIAAFSVFCDIASHNA